MYSNPRMQAIIPDWPSGQHRTTATFTIEQVAKRGERATRTTINPKTGRPNAAKKLTFARRQRIVDGDDGRTYILVDTGHTISVMQSNMQFQHCEPIFPHDADYAALLALFD